MVDGTGCYESESMRCNDDWKRARIRRGRRVKSQDVGKRRKDDLGGGDERQRRFKKVAKR